MPEHNRLIAELGHIQSFFESKAGMTVGKGKLLLLNWANVARDAAEILKDDDKRIRLLEQFNAMLGEPRNCPHCGKEV